VGTLVREKLLLSVPTFARGSGKACVERLVAHEGSIALATRFTLAAEAGRAALEGLILVMPEPDRIARLLSHLDLR
jgi:chemotaxis protein CheC